MTHLPTLPEGTTLLDVLRANPGTAGPLLDLHEAVMRCSWDLLGRCCGMWHTVARARDTPGFEGTSDGVSAVAPSARPDEYARRPRQSRHLLQLDSGGI